MTNKWDIDQLVRELETIYCNKKNDKDHWDDEAPQVRQQLEALASHLESAYSNPKAIARGGSGIIVKVESSALYGQERVIKFPRPLRDNPDEFKRLLENEIKLLANVRSRNVVTIHEAGNAVHSSNADVEVPYYVMDFVAGDDSDKVLKGNKAITAQQFLCIIQETLRAIHHLHSNNLVHVDIKPGNILVDRTFRPMVIDLGTTKRLSLSPADENDETRIALTPRFACTDALNWISKTEDESRAEGLIRRKQIHATWDLHTLSGTISIWLDLFTSTNPNKLTHYETKYLRLMTLRLFQNDYQTASDLYGIPASLLKAVRYRSINDALVDLAKIYPGNDISEQVPELSPYSYKSLQTSAGDPTALSPRLEKVLEHPALRRLSSVSQLGIVRLVYPTASHTRLEHSLGVYHNTARFIRSLYYDPVNPLFRQLTNAKNYRAVLLAALLHDVGQFPLAHDLEDIDSKLFDHRALVKTIITGQRKGTTAGSHNIQLPSLKEIFKAWDVEMNDVLSILEAKLGSEQSDPVSRILKSIISGPIDADKLDYLVRDATRLNVPYPLGIDVLRLLRCLTLIVRAQGNGVLTHIGVHEKGLVPAEFVSFSRYAMYSQVYWHHAVRAVKAMLERAMGQLLGTLDTDALRNEFKYRFDRFVLQELVKSTNKRQTIIDGTDLTCLEDTTRFDDPCSGALSPPDFRMIQFLKSEMDIRSLADAELLQQILDRKLYKRAFVFSFTEDTSVWEKFVDVWSSWSATRRRIFEIHVEKQILQAGAGVLDERNEDTVMLNGKILKSYSGRVSAELPLILIDVPPSKPGSSIDLEYIQEQDRRELIKSNRVCGKVGVSLEWKKYSRQIRDRAGRIRIYVHPEFADMVLSAVNKDWIGGILKNSESFFSTD